MALTDSSIANRRRSSSAFGMLATLVVVGSIAWPATAAANGRFPTAGQIVVAPQAPSFVVLRATFGIVVSRDAGATWDWICESAGGFVDEDPFLAVTANATILAATSKGLSTSADRGCGWATGLLDKQTVADLAVAPSMPSGAIALTTAYVGEDGGTSVYATQIYRTTDDGAHWAANGPPIDPTALVQTIDLARSDSQRVYASIVRGAGATSTAALLVSTDGGTTWTERPIPFDPNVERAAFVAAVDPTDADRVYVRTNGFTSRLLVTTDAGKTFKDAFHTDPMMGFALSADGTRVYLGGIGGLFVANASDLAFTKQSSIAVGCLTYAGRTLYACSNEASGFIVGASTDDGKTFASMLHLSTVRGPLACPAGSSTAACESEWPGVRDQIGAGARDAGTTTPDGDASTAPAASGARSTCGCRASPRSHPLVAMALLPMIALVLRRRSRGAR